MWEAGPIDFSRMGFLHNDLSWTHGVRMCAVLGALKWSVRADVETII